MTGPRAANARERYSIVAPYAWAMAAPSACMTFGTRAAFGVRGVRLYQDGIPMTMPDGQGQTGRRRRAPLIP